MLFLLFKFLYIIILAFVYGYTLQQFLNKRVLKLAEARSHFSLTTLTGFFAITVLASILSIFMPLSNAAHAIVLSGGILFYLIQRKSIHLQLADTLQAARTADRSRKVFTGISVLFIIYLSAQQSVSYDEGLYYAQFIKWMQTYKVVPGLANLHERLGFNMQWYVLSAVLDCSWISGSTDNHINGALYLLTAIYLIPGKNDKTFISLLKAGLLVMISMPHFCVYNMIAPAADMPVFYISCLLIICWLEDSAAGHSITEGKNSVFLLLAPVFLITVKVSSMPVLLFTAVIYWQVLRRKQYVQLLKMITVALVITTPWIVRNIILTGYPLFPMNLPDIFHVDWAVSRDLINYTRQDVHIFAFYRNVDVARYAADSTLHRYITWFVQYTRIYDKLIILAAMASFPMVLIRRKQLPAGFTPVYAFLLLGFAFWFIQAPDPRFGYSCLAPMMIITGVCCFSALPLRYVYVPTICIALLFQIATIGLGRHLTKVFVAEKMIAAMPGAPWWMTPAPYTPQTFTEKDPGSGGRMTSSRLCWDAELPCVSRMPEHVVMRGKSLEEGFRYEGGTPE